MYPLKKCGEIKAVSAAEVSDSPLGIGFEKLDRGVFDPEPAYDKIAALGVKWVRIQSGWARTEQQAGVYDFRWLDDIVDNLIRRGLEPWMCLCYGNGLYDEDAAKVFGAVGCPPIKTDEQKKAWRRYVAETVRHYRGRVTWFEIWNEPDGPWAWKHGPSGTEYGEFAKATAAAIREGSPEAKVIGGTFCTTHMDWIYDMFETGCAADLDALCYHGYLVDETYSLGQKYRTIRELARRYNPAMELIQGEVGTQSRPDGAGALRQGCWSPEKQAKFAARHLVAHVAAGMKLVSYFTSVDMVEALKGRVGDKASYMDFGYFGVLGADFDENGIATGNYTPKPSYRTLQVLASIFRERPERIEIPLFLDTSFFYSPQMLQPENGWRDLLSCGFRLAGNCPVWIYWKPADIVTTSYEGTLTVEVIADPSKLKLADLKTGEVYKLPESMIEASGRATFYLKNLPLRDYPLMLIFDDFDSYMA